MGYRLVLLIIAYYIKYLAVYINYIFKRLMMTYRYFCITFLSLFFTHHVFGQSINQEKTWHCLCYSERAGKDTIQATACRSSLQQCQKLEQKANMGSKLIVANALQVPCVTVTGSHPADDLGYKELWKPSHPEFDMDTLWAGYNCATEALKSSPVDRIIQRHSQLHSLTKGLYLN